MRRANSKSLQHDLEETSKRPRTDPGFQKASNPILKTTTRRNAEICTPPIIYVFAIGLRVLCNPIVKTMPRASPQWLSAPKRPQNDSGSGAGKMVRIPPSQIPDLRSSQGAGINLHAENHLDESFPPGSCSCPPSASDALITTLAYHA